jgi:hypothetical protein
MTPASKLFQAEADQDSFEENSCCTKRQRLDLYSDKVILMTPESKVHLERDIAERSTVSKTARNSFEITETAESRNATPMNSFARRLSFTQCLEF